MAPCTKRIDSSIRAIETIYLMVHRFYNIHFYFILDVEQFGVLMKVADSSHSICNKARPQITVLKPL